MNSPSAGHRAPALWLLLPLLAGLALGRATAWSSAPGVMLGAAALALALGWRLPRCWPFALPASVFLIGIVLHDLSRARLPAWTHLPPREARVEIEITRIFGPSLDGRRINGVARVIATEHHLADLVGQRLYFSLRPETSAPLLRSSRVAAVGVLQALPRQPPPHSFEHYLDATGVNFRLQRGTILRHVAPASAYRRFCAAALDRFESILRAGLGDKPELGGIYRAMLLGRKSELTDEQDALFLHSGTLHLFAISGLHIATIATTLHVLLALVPWPRLVRFGLATAALWLYTDITGGSPSAVRAFLMATLLAALPVLRLPGNTPAVLAVSAVLVLVIDPLQLFSAGFQMSYGIVTALLILGLPLANAWQRRPTTLDALPAAARSGAQKTVAWLRRILIVALSLGLAATVVSTVSSIAFFQLVTPGAFAANLVLIPLASVVVIAGCASLLCGFVGLSGLSVVFNHAAALVLWIIESVVQLVVTLPGTSMPATFRQPWIAPVAFAVVIGLMLHGYARGWRPAAGGFWPPFAALAVLLLLGVRYG